ncbi:GNAT family N-acetyltransferase [Neolewinella antarctica]|uniref:Ribosomal protein S18 acetylase RimI-like enzyme n=1 Tax=Neolewinella antarctica TaxID=442734 RepID=A0ABX0XFB3_9BACT|nr:GNAT family N-acetyltransferase [Neolewinella antarctica]NJC27437.1 ribosomal protein S18 acetylase RimI-like enzyme [Neolewinella antarctica]
MIAKPISSQLTFKKFKRENYEEYRSWYNNERIKEALYDVEGEWLAHVLNQKDGIQYAVYGEQTLVGVVGVLFPAQDHPYSVITDIAVNPALFRKGVGSQILSGLTNLHALGADYYWVAFVEVDNELAQRFFEKNGWRQGSDRKVADDMIRYEFRKT